MSDSGQKLKQAAIETQAVLKGQGIIVDQHTARKIVARRVQKDMTMNKIPGRKNGQKLGLRKRLSENGLGLLKGDL